MNDAYSHPDAEIGAVQIPALVSRAFQGLRSLTSGRGRARMASFQPPQQQGYAWGQPQSYAAPGGYYPHRSSAYIGDLDFDDDGDEIGGYDDGDDELGFDLYDLDQEIGSLAYDVADLDDDDEIGAGEWDADDLDAEIGSLFGRRARARRLRRRIERASKRRPSKRRRRRLARRRSALAEVEERIEKAITRKQKRRKSAKKSKNRRGSPRRQGGTSMNHYDIPEGDFTPYPLVDKSTELTRMTATVPTGTVVRSFNVETQEVEYAKAKPRALRILVTVTSLAAGAAAPVDTPSGTVTLSAFKIGGKGEMIYGDKVSCALVHQSESQAVGVIRVDSFREDALRDLKDGIKAGGALTIDLGAHANNDFQVEVTGAMFVDAEDVG